MTQEIWKPIKGYEGYYEISNKGNVRSLNRYILRKGHKKPVFWESKILKPHINLQGYYSVALSDKDHNRKRKRINRLVAEAFIPNPDNLTRVNHKDENKTNNNVENLEWCTTQYNNTYGTRMERIAKANCKKIFQYDLNGNLIKIWESVKECAKNGFSKSGVSEASNYRYNVVGNNKYKGFKWSKNEVC